MSGKLKMVCVCIAPLLFAPFATASIHRDRLELSKPQSLYAATPVQPSQEVKDKIAALRATGKDEDKKVADVATWLLNDGYRVFKVNQIYKDAKGQAITDVDIETSKVLIEVTVSPDGKGSQIDKYINNTTVNPSKKAVILYGENYTNAAAKKNIETLGAFVVNNSSELFKKMTEVGAK